MALTATLHTIQVALSDTDRGVYENFELRVARHPSEGLAYMLTRVLAYCLFWETDIAFSKGLSTPDEPAVWVRALDGTIKLWIEVGRPNAERLHKASKAAERVVVVSCQDPRVVLRGLAGERIHRADEIEMVWLPATLTDALEEKVAKRMNLEVMVTGGRLYVTTGTATIEGEIDREPLAAG
jgi:uncharacterized protein YaeQ